MKHKNRMLSGIFLLGLGLNGLHAQEALVTSGGDASGIGGSSSYSIGQVIYTTHSGIGGSVAQGVQHAYDISVTSGIDENFGINLELSAYPNPTSDFLILKIENNSNSNLFYYLYDMNGTLLDNQNVKGNVTSIEMLEYNPGAYFLKIMNDQIDVKTFKIIKKQ